MLGLNDVQLRTQAAQMAKDSSYPDDEKMAAHKEGVRRGLWDDF